MVNLKHLYFHVKKPLLMLNSAWRNKIDFYAGSLGKSELDPQPARRMHYRTSISGSEVIMECVINTDTIEAEVNQGTLTILGGDDATVEKSRQAANDLIFANPETWGEEK